MTTKKQDIGEIARLAKRLHEAETNLIWWKQEVIRLNVEHKALEEAARDVMGVMPPCGHNDGTREYCLSCAVKRRLTEVLEGKCTNS